MIRRLENNRSQPSLEKMFREDLPEMIIIQRPDGIKGRKSRKERVLGRRKILCIETHILQGTWKYFESESNQWV